MTLQVISCKGDDDSERIHLTSLSLLVVLIFVGIAGADNLVVINHYNKALDYANEGKFLQVLNETDRALLENQNFTLAHVTRAGIIGALGRYKESPDASDQAVGLNQKQSATWNNKAYALNSPFEIHRGTRCR